MRIKKILEPLKAQRKTFKRLLVLVMLIALASIDSAPAQGNPENTKGQSETQFCYVKHRTPDFFRDYPLNSAFEAVHVYPRPTGVGEGQSAFVFLEASDMDYIRQLNAGNPEVVNWMVWNGSGSLYSSAQKGSTATQAQWFPILLSGNIVKITEVVHQRGKVAGLNKAALAGGALDRDAVPYYIHWVPVIWRDGRITDTPKGYGLMPIYDPSDFRSKAITDMWVSMDDLLCPIDLSKSFVTEIGSWVTQGADLHSTPQLGDDNLLGSKANHTELYPPELGGGPFHVWQVTQAGDIIWGLTDWGYLVLKQGTQYYVTWGGG